MFRLTMKIALIPFLMFLYAFPAYATHEEPFVPEQGKITCATIKCHINRHKENKAHYFIPDIYAREHPFWGCTHSSEGEHVWLEENCFSDCLTILDIPTCSEVCAAIAHDIETMHIDIERKMCN